MFARNTPPLVFCLTGFSWLVLASILGLAMLIGLIQGTSVPPWVRTLHVHAVLVGGVVQIVLGGLLLLIPSRRSDNGRESAVHPLTLWAMNGGLIGMLIGFWLHQNAVVGVAGLAVIAVFCSVAHTLWARVRYTWNASIRPWYYALALLSLVSGSAGGVIIAFGFIPQSYGYARLAHIHPVVLGFVVLALVGMMHHILPTVWNRPFASLKHVQLATILMPIGTVLLIGGFLNSSIWAEMIAGTVLFIGAMLFAINLFRTWLNSAHRGSAASDHFLVGTFFLLFTIILGIGIGANNLSSPPILPYGRLHLVAYTHMTFIGFILNAIMGLISYLAPITLAADRISSPRKRGPYLDQLMTAMDRGRIAQVSAVCLGTMGLGLLAALTWNVPMTSVYVQIAMWTCLGLLMSGLMLFSVKLTSVIVKKPDTLRTARTSTDELKLTA